MRHDLTFLREYCLELGFGAEIAETSLHVDLGEGAVLLFVNSECDEDCSVGFAGTPWHFHGESLTFSDPRGHYIELDHLNLLSGLASGAVLLCTRLVRGTIADRWLAHSEYNDEFRFMEPAEHLLVCRAGRLARSSE